MASTAFLQKAYLAYFGRPVDPTGSVDFANTSEAAVANAFAASAESKALYGSTFSYSQINAIYQALFNRDAEPAGLAYWYAKVADGTYTAAGAAIAILNGAQNADKTAIDNKLAASAAFSAALDTTAELVGYSGDAAAASARAFLSSVTTTPATAAAVDAAVAAAVAAKTAVAGQTFTLTTGADNFSGTAGADTVNGLMDYTGGTSLTSSSTLTAADQLAGGAGTDSLNVTVTGGTGGTTFAAANITGFETLNIRNVSGQTNSLDASTVAGLTGIYADRATSQVTLTNVADGATVGVKGDGTAANGALAFGYKTATQAINLAISGGVTQGAITGDATGVTDAATAATITSTGAANVVGTVDLLTGASTLKSLTIDAATNLSGQIAAQSEGDFASSSTLTVKGAATLVELTAALANAITTVDASGMTAGGIKATLGTGATTAKGGAGVDTITVSSTTTAVTTNDGNDVIVLGTNIMGTGGSVDGGAGTDTLSISAGNTLTATTAAKVSNVEVLRVDSAATQTYDFSLISGLTNLEVGTGTSIIVNKLGASTPVKVIGTQTTDLALNLASVSGTTDSISVTLENQNAAMSVAALSITGVETLNLTSSATKGANANTVTTLNGTNNADLRTVTISGSQDLSLTTGSLNQSLTINGSAATGKLTIDASSLAGVATISGGSGADTITGSSQADIVNAGAGNDTLNVAGSGDTLNGEAGDDIFTSGNLTAVAGLSINGGDGTDTIRVTTGGSADYSATGVSISNIEKVTLVSTGGATGITFNNSQITGQAWLISGDAANQVDTVTVSVAAGASLDLSKLTFADNWASTDIVAINGAGAQETIVGSSKADVISGGGGIDTLTGGTGADTFKISSGAAANRDIITDFKAGSTAGDVFNFNSGVATLTGTNNFASASALQAVTTAGNTTAAAATEVLVVKTATIADVTSANSLNGTNLLTALGGSLTGAIAGQNDILIAVGITGGGTAIYYASSADNAIIASEISLVGVLQGTAVGDLVYGNFANAA